MRPPTHSVEPDSERERRRDEPRPWDDYKHLIIHRPRGYIDYRDRIRSLLSDPMLPMECTRLLDDYLSTLSQRVAVVGEVLTEAVPEFPDQYPTVDLARRAAPNWLQARINTRVSTLEPHADAITDFVRSYLGTDSVYRRRGGAISRDAPRIPALLTQLRMRLMRSAPPNK